MWNLIISFKSVIRISAVALCMLKCCVEILATFLSLSLGISPIHKSVECHMQIILRDG